MDIVIPYVDCSDPTWIEGFVRSKYPGIHGAAPIRAALIAAKRRYSDYGLFVYWWRAVSTMYSDVGTVHLLVQSKSQVPAWLNTDKGVQVHLHSEFMTRAVPSYNSSCIELAALHHLLNTGALSDRFLLLNDDMYFIGHCTDANFECGGKPLTYIEHGDEPQDGLFGDILRNNTALCREASGVIKFPIYKNHHLAVCYDSGYCKKLLNTYWERIENTFTRFRSNRNLNHWWLRWMQDYNGVSKHSNDFPHEGYIPYVGGSIQKESVRGRTMICINDGCSGGDHGLSILSSMYPEKCRYEK